MPSTPVSSARVHGGAPLVGSVRLSGFKHAAVTIISASLLSDQPVRLRNVPDVRDISVLADVVRALGGVADLDLTSGSLTLDCADLQLAPIDDRLTGQVHGTLYLLPVMLARFGEARLPANGGCAIGDEPGGARPTEHLVEVLRRFGASFEHRPDGVFGRAGRLVGTRIDLSDFASRAPDGTLTGSCYSGATKAALLAASVAKGTTVICEPYPKPDVTDLVAALEASGVPVARQGHELIVDGLDGPLPGFTHSLVGDIPQLMTLAAAAVCTDGAVTVRDVDARVRAAAAPELDALDALGVHVDRAGDDLLIRPGRDMRGFDIVVTSHGIFSDSQPFLALMMLGARGHSRVTETVWHRRFTYMDELVRLGADVTVSGSSAVVRPSRLVAGGGPLTGGDLRSSAALLVAALAASSGPTVVHGLDHLYRGYVDLIGDLRSLGAGIEDLGHGPGNGPGRPAEAVGRHVAH